MNKQNFDENKDIVNFLKETTTSLKSLIINKALLFCLTLAPFAAQSHEANSLPYGPFLSGITHPVLGFDHLLAMISVGMISAQIGGRAIWSVPTTFVVVMFIGGLIGINIELRHKPVLARNTFLNAPKCFH